MPTQEEIARLYRGNNVQGAAGGPAVSQVGYGAQPYTMNFGMPQLPPINFAAGGQFSDPNFYITQGAPTPPAGSLNFIPQAWQALNTPGPTRPVTTFERQAHNATADFIFGTDRTGWWGQFANAMMPKIEKPVAAAAPGTPAAASGLSFSQGPQKRSTVMDLAQAMGIVNPTPTSSYGEQRKTGAHNAIDIAGQKGSPVNAVKAGKAIVGFDKNSGNYVKIQADDGTTYSVAHLDSASVKPGQRVEVGMELGKLGSTGRSSGPHVHFSTFGTDGKRQDPTQWYTPQLLDPKAIQAMIPRPGMLSTNVNLPDAPVLGSAGPPPVFDMINVEDETAGLRKNKPKGFDQKEASKGRFAEILGAMAAGAAAAQDGNIGQMFALAGAAAVQTSARGRKEDRAEKLQREEAQRQFELMVEEYSGRLRGENRGIVRENQTNQYGFNQAEMQRQFANATGQFGVDTREAEIGLNREAANVGATNDYARTVATTGINAMQQNNQTTNQAALTNIQLSTQEKDRRFNQLVTLAQLQDKLDGGGVDSVTKSMFGLDARSLAATPGGDAAIIAIGAGEAKNKEQMINAVALGIAQQPDLEAFFGEDADRLREVGQTAQQQKIDPAIAMSQEIARQLNGDQTGAKAKAAIIEAAKRGVPSAKVAANYFGLKVE